jgi:hypothetical protein
VPNVKRVFIAASTVVGALVYVWVAAVRAVPAVRARKRAARADRMR